MSVLHAVAVALIMCISVLAAWAHAEPAPASTSNVAVSAARLLDVRTGRYLERPLVLIADGRITAVGTQGQLALPQGTRTIDLPGLTLLPGLIDMHVHLDSDPRYGGYSYLQFTDSFWPVIAVRNASVTLNASFTTVRNMGAERFNDVGLMQGIDEGLVTGPRVVPAGHAIGATGGHCDSTYFPPSMDQQSPAVADGPDALRRMVRLQHKYGAKVIKICATGGVFSNDAVGVQQMRLEEIRAVTDEAHMLDLRVAAHAHGPEGIRAAIEAGVDTIEHASLVDDAGIRMARAAGTWFGMDIYNTDYTQAAGRANGTRESEIKKDADIGEAQRQNFCKAVKGGVRQIFSSDAGVYPHGDNARQFAVMVKYCATPLQAIQAATVNAAEALGMSSDVGEASAGHFGDLIGVEGDPLTDVRVLEQAKFVMKGGAVVRAPLSAARM